MIILYVVVLASVSLSHSGQSYTVVPRRCPSAYMSGSISVLLLIVSIGMLFTFSQRIWIEKRLTESKSEINVFGITVSIIFFLTIGTINSLMFAILLSNATITSWWWMALNSIIVNMSEVLAVGLSFLSIISFRSDSFYKHSELSTNSSHISKISTIDRIDDPEYIMGSNPSIFNLYNNSSVNQHIDIFTPYYHEEKDDGTAPSLSESRMSSNDDSSEVASSFFTARRGFSLIRVEENRI